MSAPRFRCVLTRSAAALGCCQLFDLRMLRLPVPAPLIRLFPPALCTALPPSHLLRCRYEGIQGDYSELLASSIFCLVVPGDGWSARMDDATLHGCIPVIIMVGAAGGEGAAVVPCRCQSAGRSQLACHRGLNPCSLTRTRLTPLTLPCLRSPPASPLQDNVDVSFDSAIDLSTFTLRIPQADAEKLPEILQAVPEERRQEMRRNMARVWQRCGWGRVVVVGCEQVLGGWCRKVGLLRRQMGAALAPPGGRCLGAPRLPSPTQPLSTVLQVHIQQLPAVCQALPGDPAGQQRRGQRQGSRGPGRRGGGAVAAGPGARLGPRGRRCLWHNHGLAAQPNRGHKVEATVAAV